MLNTIEVKITNNYGNSLVYPMNEQALKLQQRDYLS